MVERRGYEQLLADDALDVLEVAALVLDGASDQLRQIRVTVRPCADSVHQRLRLPRLPSEAQREHIRLLRCEVLRLDQYGRRTPVRGAGELLARRDAGEREREALIVWLVRAPLVASFDRREQLGAERQLDRALDRVEHDRDRRGRVGEDHVPEEIGEPTLTRDGGALPPPARQVDVQAQLVDHAVRDCICPAFDVRVFAPRLEARDVDDGHELAIAPQRATHAREQARLAGAVCSEHVAEAPRLERRLELLVGSPLHVRRPIGRHRTSDHEKLSRLHDPSHGGEIVAAAWRCSAVTQFG